MLNYIKSEFYRVFHGKNIYLMTLVLAALPIFYNFILYAFTKQSKNFPYGTTSFSFSTIVANPMLFCYIAFIIYALLYEADKRNGNLKNVIAYGISRIKVFAGQCVVSLAASILMMVVVLSCYIISAMLLLENAGPVKVHTVFTEVPAVLLIAIAALILGIVALNYFDSMIIGLISWYMIMFGIPTVLLYLGMKIDFIMNIAKWMPANFFKTEMQVNMSSCITIWDSAEGMVKCLIAGLSGIAVFSFTGVLLLRKKEI